MISGKWQAENILLVTSHLPLPNCRCFVHFFSTWGLAFLTGVVAIFLLAILTVVMYLMVTPIEERELRSEYGSEYDSYAQAVPRFVPRLRKTAELQTGD